MKFTAIIPIILLVLIIISCIVYGVENYAINQLLISINDNYWIQNIQEKEILIPLYDACNNDNHIKITLSLDPLSDIGIENVYLVLINGTLLKPVYVNYNPKHVELRIDCKDLYGILLKIENYTSIYPILKIVKGYYKT